MASHEVVRICVLQGYRPHLQGGSGHSPLLGFHLYEAHYDSDTVLHLYARLLNAYLCRRSHRINTYVYTS